MQVVASDEARALVAARGGRLYVSVKTARCCGRLKTLEARSEAKDGADYVSAAVDDGLEIFMPRNLVRPDQLDLEARRFPRRVEAYWNGCAWIV